MTTPVPATGLAPAIHNSSCQSATQPGCYCSCVGMMHQRNILIEAIESRWGQQAFNIELEKLFGSAFTMLSTDPTGSQRARRENGWESFTTAGTAKRASQIEQRVVDVTLRDILSIVHSIHISQKVGWLHFLDALTLQRNWSVVVRQIEHHAGPHDNQSGYFWSSMLASTTGLEATGSAITMNGIEKFPASVSTVFDQTRYPRANSGNSVQDIKEMATSAVVTIAASEIADAWTHSRLSVQEKPLVAAVVGSALSADLWRHPAAVRYLLLPAVTSLRAFAPGAKFSLDQPHRPVEQIIDDELGQKWRKRGVW